MSVRQSSIFEFTDFSGALEIDFSGVDCHHFPWSRCDYDWLRIAGIGRLSEFGTSRPERIHLSQAYRKYPLHTWRRCSRWQVRQSKYDSCFRRTGLPVRHWRWNHGTCVFRLRANRSMYLYITSTSSTARLRNMSIPSTSRIKSRHSFRS